MHAARKWRPPCVRRSNVASGWPGRNISVSCEATQCDRVVCGSPEQVASALVGAHRARHGSVERRLVERSLARLSITNFRPPPIPTERKADRNWELAKEILRHSWGGRRQ